MICQDLSETSHSLPRQTGVAGGVGRGFPCPENNASSVLLLQIVSSIKKKKRTQASALLLLMLSDNFSNSYSITYHSLIFNLHRPNTLLLHHAHWACRTQVPLPSNSSSHEHEIVLHWVLLRERERECVCVCTHCLLWGARRLEATEG